MLGMIESESSIDELLKRPERFSFFQSMRLLKKALAEAELHDDGHTQRIRFESVAELAFPASEIRQLELVNAEESDPTFRMVTTFLGLAGHDGPLPDHYTELILRRVRAKDHTLYDFLSIFNNRLLSLFYQSWEKTQFAVQVELGQEDRINQMLHAFLGLKSTKLRKELGFDTQKLLPFTSQLQNRPTSLHTMRLVLEAYMPDLTFELEQFHGQWVQVDEDSQTQLGNPTLGGELGAFCLLGERMWDVQGQCKLKIGPMTYTEFYGLLPGTQRAIEIQRLCEFLGGGQLTFLIELILPASEISAPQLQPQNQGQHPLGYAAWLGGGLAGQYASITFGSSTGAAVSWK